MLERDRLLELHFASYINHNNLFKVYKYCNWDIWSCSLKQVAKTTSTMKKQSFVKLNPIYLYEKIKMHNFGKDNCFLV